MGQAAYATDHASEGGRVGRSRLRTRRALNYLELYKSDVKCVRGVAGCLHRHARRQVPNFSGL